MNLVPGVRDRLTVELAGLPATLHSAHPDFMEYAGVHLAPLLAEPETAPVIDATLTWHEEIPPGPAERRTAFPDLAAMDRVDRDVYRKGTEIAWFRIDELPSLFLRFAWDGQQLRVHGDFYVYLSRNPYGNLLRRSLRRRQLEQLRRRRFTTLLYYLVYYPCFWVLERTRDLHPIHAAGVEIDGAVIVLAGPSGVGKSTLVTGLAGTPGGRLLSDTFLLQNGTTVYAVPEPLLLDTWSQNWIGEAASQLTRIPHRYCLSRQGFHWPVERSCREGQARAVLFPQRAPAAVLRPLAPDKARNRISVSNLIVNDLRRYWAFASVLELLDPSPIVLAREASLTRLTDAVPAYDLLLEPSTTRPAIRAQLDELLRPPGALTA